MPLHHHRSARSRLLTPLAIGVLAFIGIGSVAAGITMAPGTTPVGAVAGAIDGGPGLTPRQSSDPDQTTSALLAPIREIPRARDGDPGRAPPLSGLTGYRWPLPNARITLPFGPTPWGSRVVDGKSFHDGVDLATFCGDRIVAAHDGIVLAAGRHYDGVMGWLGDLTPYFLRLDAKDLWSTLPIVVVIDDGNGYRSVYAHFGTIFVEQGQTVTAGSLLGYEGRTGRASGCHLHYGLFSPEEPGEFAIDPAVVKRMKVPTAEIARVDPLLVLPELPTPTHALSPDPSTDPSASPPP